VPIPKKRQPSVLWMERNGWGVLSRSTKLAHGKTKLDLVAAGVEIITVSRRVDTRNSIPRVGISSV
jgi:hypothetical protein